MFFEPKKFGLALGSGGSRGYAHIGVIKSLIKNDIPIDLIAGTSIGALIGGMYAAFGDINKVEELVKEINYKKLINLFLDPFSPSGIIKGEKVTAFLKENLGDIRIEDLKIPFQAVATDIISANPYILKSGSLVTAIRASISVPIFFTPINLDNKVLMDGGSTIPIPVDLLKDMGADVVCAVNLYQSLFPLKTPLNPDKAKLTSIFNTTSNIFMYRLSLDCVKNADVVINPDVSDIKPLDFIQSKSFITVGEKAADSKILEIKRSLSYLPFF